MLSVLPTWTAQASISPAARRYSYLAGGGQAPLVATASSSQLQPAMAIPPLLPAIPPQPCVTATGRSGPGSPRPSVRPSVYDNPADYQRAALHPSVSGGQVPGPPGLIGPEPITTPPYPFYVVPPSCNYTSYWNCILNGFAQCRGSPDPLACTQQVPEECQPCPSETFCMEDEGAAATHLAGCCSHYFSAPGCPVVVSPAHLCCRRQPPLMEAFCSCIHCPIGSEYAKPGTFSPQNCACECGPGATNCCGVCTDLTRDPANCGECGMKLPGPPPQYACCNETLPTCGTTGTIAELAITRAASTDPSVSAARGTALTFIQMTTIARYAADGARTRLRAVIALPEVATARRAGRIAAGNALTR
jgi:hypothetical protein